MLVVSGKDSVALSCIEMQLFVDVCWFFRVSLNQLGI